jgi:hypothetical protein
VLKFKGLHLERVTEFRQLARGLVKWRRAYQLQLEKSQSIGQSDEEEVPNVQFNYKIRNNRLYLDEEEVAVGQQLSSSGEEEDSDYSCSEAL